MRYFLALLGLAALVNAFVVGQARGPDWGMTIMVGFVMVGVVLLSAAVIVSRLDQVIRLLKDRPRD